MDQTFSLVDGLAVSDLQVYLSRAGRVEDGSVRLVARGGVLAAYTAVLYPHGLLDRTPTVLGLRTFETAPDAEFDAVVPTRSLLDRLARAGDPAAIRLPLEVSTVTWAGISPPRGGWSQVGGTTSAVLRRVASEGVAEVARAVPEGTGEQLVWRVRGSVWGAPIEEVGDVPAGVAFAADSLGFLGPEFEPVPIFETGTWTRLSLRRGHVLVKRAAWSLRG
ncbi:hypothetical protein [Gryllotalpicola ginsengisoli]|uniref:hypothetical protein n=1 Tax=Gryllotalpicola ginsengisoli TaxID=444608 RepID=UPI0003B7265C|nr:hypothetical protein [Gryllotalpicola ginsengisoli]